MATPGVAARGALRSAASRYYVRFDRIDRTMHAFLMITFIGCALTGVPLLEADHAWARTLAASRARQEPTHIPAPRPTAPFERQAVIYLLAAMAMSTRDRSAR